MMNKNIIKLVMLMAFVVLLWFALPYVHFGDHAIFNGVWIRFFCLVGLFGFGVVNIFSWSRVKSFCKIQQFKPWLINKLDRKKEDVDKKEKIKAIQKSVKTHANRAFSSLKSIFHEDRKLKKYLRKTPWFIALGLNQSGKSTLIQNSRLNFSPAEQLDMSALQSQFNTENQCQWWFTKNAVIISASQGNIQDEDNSGNEKTEGVWQALMRLIKQYRLKKSMSGVILMIDLAQLLIEDTVNKQAYSHQIRKQLHDINARFHMRVPVYVMFTKTDLISGFTEFFNDLNQEDRNQVWGCTLPLDLPTDINQITTFLDQEYDRLTDRLNERLFWRLSSEHEPNRRELISYFPQQILLLKQTIIRFLAQTFSNGDHSQDDRVHFRGFYFTSAMQYGRTLNVLMTAMGEPFNLERPIMPEQIINHQSYFIHDCFHHVIFPETELVGNRPQSNLRKRRITYLVTPFVLALGIWGLSLSYTKNHQGIKQAEDQLIYYHQLNDQLDTNNQDLTATLPMLNALKKVNIVYQHVNHPWLLYFGLYTPHVINRATQHALQSVLQAEFLPRLIDYFEQQLNQDMTKPHALYDDFKGYMAFNLTKRIEPHWIVPPAFRGFEKTAHDNPNQLADLKQFTQLATQQKIPSMTVDYNLIARARDTLNQVSPGTRAYWYIKQKAMMSDHAGLNFTDQLNATFDQVFDHTDQIETVPILFTKTGFHQIFSNESDHAVERVAKNDYGVGLNSNSLSRESKKRMTHELRDLYTQEYFSRWQQEFNQLKIMPFQNLDQAIRVLEILSSRQSPLPKLMRLIHDNTAPVVQTHQSESSDFKALNRTIETQGNQYTKISDINKTLKALYHFMDDINNADNRHQASFKAAQAYLDDTLSPNPIKTLHQEADHLPDPLKRWYNSIAGYSLGVLFQSALSVIDHQYQETVYKAYQESISKRYPIDPNARAELNCDSFTQFFGQKGIFDTFYKNYLVCFIDTSAKQWQWKSPLGQTLGVSDEILHKIQNVMEVHNAFFAAGNTPALSFTIQPLTLDANSKQVYLRFGEHHIHYAHGPQQTMTWTWPMKNNNTTLTFTDFHGYTPAKSYQGNWAWFKLLHAGHIKATETPNVYHFTVKIGRHYATFKITSPANIAAFNMSWLRKLALPMQLS